MISRFPRAASHIAAVVLVSVSTPACADDWPCYRGPNHNGISDETGWKSEFDDDPKQLWKAEVGIGFSSFSVAAGKAYTAGWDAEQDTVYCFDAVTGREIWKHSYPADLGDKFYEGGTSATPTIHEGKAYWLSRWGDAFCFDAAKGDILWEKQLQKETELPIPDWGYAGSPYILGDKVILNIGAGGVAVEKATGKVIWKSAGGNAGYSTPFPAKIDGREVLLLAAGKSYRAIEGATGRLVWEFPWNTQFGVNGADPIPWNDEIFVSSGYEKGAALFRVNAGKPETVWQSKVMRNQFNSCVRIGDHLYGTDGNDGKGATLKCIEWKTGKMIWSARNFGPSGLMVADNKIIALTEKGELQIAPVSPQKFEPTTRAQVLGGRCWTTPVLANGRIYCRNAAGSVVCLDVGAK